MGVALLGPRPNGSAKRQVDHDNGSAPHVESSRVVRAVLCQHLWCDVRLAAADARRAEAYFAHVLAALAAGLAQARVRPGKHLGDAEIGDLELAVFGEQQVLQLDVAVGNAIRVQIADALDQLLEQAETILPAVFGLEVALRYEAEQVTLGTVLHDMIPASVIGTEADRLHDIGMMQTLADSVLGLDLVVVFLLGLAMRLSPEFLDGIHFAGRTLAHHERHLGRRAFAEVLAVAAKQLVLILVFFVQIAHINGETIGEAEAHAAGLCPGTGIRR